MLIRVFFAPDLAPWEKWWLNYFNKKPLRDQCHVRGRRIFAYSVQPLLVGLMLAVYETIGSVGAFIWFLLGMRYVGWRALTHPFEDDSELKEVFFQNGWRPNSSVFLTKADDSVQPFWITALCPWSLLLGGWCWWALWHVYHVSPPQAFIMALVPVVLAVWLVRNFLLKPETVESEEELDQREEARLLAEYDLIVCPGKSVPLEATVSNLPAAKRTFYLRFQAFKASVCKPFAS